MRRIVPVLSIVCLLGVVLCSIFLFQSNWSFSFLLKLLFIFISLFTISVAINTSNFSTVISVFSLICFGGTIAALSSTDLYLTLWNFSLAGHTLLIGYILYKKIKSPFSILQFITTISIIISSASFTIIILLKSQNELIFICLFFLLALTSILLVVNEITSLLNRK